MSGRSSDRSKRGPKSKRQGEVFAFRDPDALEMLTRLIVGMAMSGGAIRVGLTRDMGALGIGVYKGEDYGTEYIRPTDDLGSELEDIADAWEIPLAHFDDVAGAWLLD